MPSSFFVRSFFVVFGKRNKLPGGERCVIVRWEALMLHEIHIQNYAVIDSLRVEFHPGLNVLTGETGSG